MGDPFAKFQLETLPDQLSKAILPYFLFVLGDLKPAEKDEYRATRKGKAAIFEALTRRHVINQDMKIGAWPLVRLLRKRIEEDPGSACLADILKVCENYNEMMGIAEC